MTSYDAFAEFRMTGHNVIITGGAQNIGAGIAKTISGAGAKVMITDLNGEMARKGTLRRESTKVRYRCGNHGASGPSSDCEICFVQFLADQCLSCRRDGLFRRIRPVSLDGALWEKIMQKERVVGSGKIVRSRSSMSRLLSGRWSLAAGYDVDHPEFGTPAYLTAVTEFFGEHHAALVNAAELLGGPAAAERAIRLTEAAGRATRVSRCMRRELVAMHRLLSLANVGDPDLEETARFVAIDPEGPDVEAICLLSDNLLFFLDRLIEIEEAPNRGENPARSSRAA
jgi:hypothetical protein